MAPLSERDMKLVLDFVGEAYDAQDLAEFRAVLLPGIHRLVASEYVGYNEVEEGGRAAVTINSPELPEWALSAWDRHAGENPLLRRYLRTRDGRPRRFSDVASTAELRRTALYQELYRPLDLEHQVAFTLPSTPELTIGVVSSRGGRDYSDRDRRLLELARPHLIQAYRAAQLRERLVGIVEGLRHGLQADGTAIVVVERNGLVGFISAAAAALLDGLWEMPAPEVGQALQGPLASWLDRAPGAGSIEISDQSDALLVRSVAAAGGTRVVMLERAARVLSLEALRGLGLTPREAEVLHGLARGQSQPALASGLQISPRTVAKHVQRIHAKLSVSNRTQAVATAWAAMSGAPTPSLAPTH
jgi:DNA-binding CsgD family transcriptional regulator